MRASKEATVNGRPKDLLREPLSEQKLLSQAALNLATNWGTGVQHKSISSMNLLSVIEPLLYGIAPVRGAKREIEGN